MRQFLWLSLLMVSIIGMKESESGMNDWSRTNIGQVEHIEFIKSRRTEKTRAIPRKPNLLFFQSSLGFFGHLDADTGLIEERHEVEKGQTIINTNQNVLGIASESGQLILYDKETLVRRVDNRLLRETLTHNLHSYLQIQTRVLMATTNTIYEFEGREKPRYEAIITMPDNTHCLVLYHFEEQAYGLIWQSQTKKLCVNEVKGGGMIEKDCYIMAKQYPNALDYFMNQGEKGFYFGMGEGHFFFNHVQVTEVKQKPRQTHKLGATLSKSTFGESSYDRSYAQVNSDLVVSYESVDNGVMIRKHDKNGKTTTDSTVIEQWSGQIHRIWVDDSQQMLIVVQFEDLQLAAARMTQRGARELWNRQQSLAYLDKVLFMQYEGYSDHLDNQYHRHITNDRPFIHQLLQTPKHFLMRVQYEVADMLATVKRLFTGLFRLGDGITHTLEWGSFMNLWKAELTNEEERKYGLQKYMICMTTKSTMLALDTKTAQILWKKHMAEHSLVALLKLKEQYEKQVAIAITYHKSTTSVFAIMEDGEIVLKKKFATGTKPSAYKISSHSVILVAEGSTYQFDINPQLTEATKRYSFYREREGSIEGFSIEGNGKLLPTWTFHLPSSTKLKWVQSAYHGQSHSLLPISNDKKAIFKNVDFSNLAVVATQTKDATSSSGKLLLFIINAITGSVLLTEYQTEVNIELPINLAYDENSVIVTYYSQRNRVYEIWNIEALQNPQESTLLSNMYEPMREQGSIIFRSTIHGTALAIARMYVSQSKEALLRRHLVFLTREDKIYLMSRDLISSRRPKYPEPEKNLVEGQFVNTKFPVEEYLLPVIPTFYLNYDMEMHQLAHVRFSSSRLQSTIFMFSYGVDQFLIRLAPQKSFDLLSDSFNYLQLFAVLVIATALALYARQLALHAKLVKHHLD